MSLRSPFPIPYGWFQVAWPGDVKVGQVVPLQYFGQHLALWRDDNGVPHVNDAFCPHLGAHFGHGGSVDGEELICPFHGWRFDAEGQNTLIPYSERLNKKACVRSYPTVERNGLIMAWYHPEGAAPMWEIPEIPEFSDPEHFTEMVTRDYTVEAPWQELAENGVDSAHFRYVHHTEEVPELESYEVDGPRNTPIDETRCHMRFNFTVRKLGDDAALNSSVGQAFVDEIHKQVQEDKPIWENKAHLVRPALADTDGPVMKFRKWAAQFYAEGVDDSTLVYAPTGSFPAAPLETASRKYGSDPFAEAEATS